MYDQLAADAQNRYLVTYTPTNTARDGAWRGVNLTASWTRRDERVPVQGAQTAADPFDSRIHRDGFERPVR